MIINSYDDFLKAIKKVNELQAYSGVNSHDNEYSDALNDLLKRDRETYQRYQRTMLKTFKRSIRANADIERS